MALINRNDKKYHYTYRHWYGTEQKFPVGLEVNRYETSDPKRKDLSQHHPFVLTKDRFKGDVLPIYSYGQLSGYRATLYETSIGDLDLNSYENKLLRQKAVFRFQQELKEVSFNAALAFKERVETIDLVTQRISQVYRAMLAAKRGDYKRVAKILRCKPLSRRRYGKLGASQKRGAGLYLEYSFGWSPIYNDIYALANISMNKEPTFAVRGRSVETTVYDTTSGNWLNSTHVLGSITRTCVCSGRFRITNFGLITAKELGLTNPVALAWEAAPLSFVANWFLPVGSWLSQFDTFSGVSLMTGSITYTARGHLTFSTKRREDDSKTYWYGKAEKTVYQKIRHLESNFVVTLPRPNINLNAGKGLSMIALIVQIFR